MLADLGLRSGPVRGTTTQTLEGLLRFTRELTRITMTLSSVEIPLRISIPGFVMAANGNLDFDGVWRG